MNIRAEPRSAENRSANIEKLAELINDVEIAMLTTVARSGHLVSRPLGTQEVEFD
nr:pyridoxamine 5'-phosphate oxidase family protein [Lysobacter sp.]